MMTPNDHIQEVLDRDAGWTMRGQWPVLEMHSCRCPGSAPRAYIIIYVADTDTWARTYLTPSDAGVPPEDLTQRAWTAGYFSAAAAADDVEEVVRLTAMRQVDGDYRRALEALMAHRYIDCRYTGKERGAFAMSATREGRLRILNPEKL